MLFGWATPTEAGALGAFSTLAVRLAPRHELGRSSAARMLDAAKLTVMIFTIIWGVLIFVRFLGFADLPLAFSGWIRASRCTPLLVVCSASTSSTSCSAASWTPSA